MMFTDYLTPKAMSYSLIRNDAAANPKPHHHIDFVPVFNMSDAGIVQGGLPFVLLLAIMVRPCHYAMDRAQTCLKIVAIVGFFSVNKDKVKLLPFLV